MTHVAGRMCYSQVCDFGLKLIGEKDVCWFDVEVGHVECFMNVVETMKASLDDLDDLLGSDCLVFRAVSEYMKISLWKQLKIDEHLALRDHSDHVLMETDLDHGGCFEGFVVFESGMKEFPGDEGTVRDLEFEHATVCSISQISGVCAELNEGLLRPCHRCKFLESCHLKVKKYANMHIELNNLLNIFSRTNLKKIVGA